MAVLFGICAIVSFIVAFMMNGTGNDHSAWFSPTGWMLLGLIFLSLCVTGVEDRFKR
jgi:predicted Co/Zn/Cd cation transporter (cation efflux family)